MSSPVAAPTQVKTDSGAVVSLVLGVISLIGLVFPPMLGLGIAGIVLGWTARKRIARSGGEVKGKRIAIAGIALSVVGCLESLVLPGFVVSVLIYAAFHGGQCGGC